MGLLDSKVVSLVFIGHFTDTVAILNPLFQIAIMGF